MQFSTNRAVEPSTLGAGEYCITKFVTNIGDMCLKTGQEYGLVQVKYTFRKRERRNQATDKVLLLLTCEFSKLKFGDRVSFGSWETHLPRNNCKLEELVIFLSLYENHIGKGQ